jgi:predicted DNA-binding protein YlxM (UPF0122 family)
MEYLSLDEYQNIAEKLLSASFPKLAAHIMSDNEKMGEVINALIKADWHYDGRGTIYGYRKQRVAWVISNFFNKKQDLSLNYDITESMELSDTIPDKLHFDSVEYRDELENLRDKIANSKVLTGKEKICISRYLTEGVELADIATELDIHKEAVKLSVRRGLSKLGLHNEYNQRFRERRERRKRGKVNTGTDGI